MLSYICILIVAVLVYIAGVVTGAVWNETAAKESRNNFTKLFNDFDALVRKHEPLCRENAQLKEDLDRITKAYQRAVAVERKMREALGIA